jgi:murein L,D-transpeptidase YafK
MSPSKGASKSLAPSACGRTPSPLNLGVGRPTTELGAVLALTLPMSREFACLLAVAFSTTVGQSADSQPINSPIADARIVVLKSDRQLILYSGEEAIRTYRIGLGFEPKADKTRQGDGATPEGRFSVCVKNPNSQYYVSLGIDYPNGEDAERGLRSGLISKAEHDSIVEAVTSGRRPPWNTALGGEIFIHGRGSSGDWTLGCIALDDADMKELYAAVSVGTEVEIRP